MNEINKVIAGNIRHYMYLNNLAINQLADFLKLQILDLKAKLESETDFTLVELHRVESLFSIDLKDLLEPNVTLHTDRFNIIQLGDLENEDRQAIASFNKIIKNYKKMKKIASDHNLLNI